MSGGGWCGARSGAETTVLNRFEEGKLDANTLMSTGVGWGGGSVCMCVCIGGGGGGGREKEISYCRFDRPTMLTSAGTVNFEELFPQIKLEAFSNISNHLSLQRSSSTSYQTLQPRRLFSSIWTHRQVSPCMFPVDNLRRFFSVSSPFHK